MAALAEYCTVIGRLWTTDDPFDVDGTRVRLISAFGNPKPVQHPHPDRHRRALVRGCNPLSPSTAEIGHVVLALPSPFPVDVARRVADELGRRRAGPTDAERPTTAPTTSE